MSNKITNSEIKRPVRRASAPRRHARIDLGDTRSESFGEWLFNHRVGLLVVFAVFVLSGTVLATARYDVERIDLEYLIEIVPEEFEEQPVRETKPIPSIEELSQRVQNVRNVISNDAATEESSGSSEEFDEDIEKLMEEITEGMDANRSAYEEGMNSVKGSGKSGKGGGDNKGDSKDKDSDQKGKYQGACTVSYSFTEPVRSHRDLYIPAYTAKGGGVVVLEVLIDRNGAVKSARVAQSTNSELNQVALNAARNTRTRFNIDGSAPSPHKGTITYTFIAQ
jgi:TonB family protein